MLTRAGPRVAFCTPGGRLTLSKPTPRIEPETPHRGSHKTPAAEIRTGSPAGTHDPHGWPTFAGWPVHNTVTHQQVYWVWLARAWMAGLRLIVAQTVEDVGLCAIEPLKSHSCNETASIELQIKELHALQSYIDAQNGGPGRGWFRLVYTPAAER